MRRGRVGGAVTISCAVLLLTGCGFVTVSEAEKACSDAVLRDWSDGGVTSVYPDHCYLAAIDALPEDLRAYSSAADDIARAMQVRRADEGPSIASAAARKVPTRGLSEVPTVASSASPGLRGFPFAVVLLAVAGVAVVGSGLAAFVVQRIRGRE